VKRPHKIINDAFGNEIKMPTTTEASDWFAVCQCGQVCGETFGHSPDDDDRKYTACPICSSVGEPNIKWLNAEEATAK
jgi:hypothetical protein